MTGRNERGRFVTGNPWASIGGRRRAAMLTPERRRAIAALGYRAMCERHYGGDRSAAGRAAVQKANARGAR